MDIVVKDSNGTQLTEGDTVTVIKDLKLKGLVHRDQARHGDQEHPLQRQ